jgi:hypothetical protein
MAAAISGGWRISGSHTHAASSGEEEEVAKAWRLASQRIWRQLACRNRIINGSKHGGVKAAISSSAEANRYQPASIGGENEAMAILQLTDKAARAGCRRRHENS